MTDLKGRFQWGKLVAWVLMVLGSWAFVALAVVGGCKLAAFAIEHLYGGGR